MVMIKNPPKTPKNVSEQGRNVSGTTYSKKWANTKGGIAKPSAPPSSVKKV